MPKFKVMCFNGGVWDKSDPRDVEALNEREAAEQIIGRSLQDAGKLGQLCAEVWLPSTPEEKSYFYI